MSANCWKEAYVAEDFSRLHWSVNEAVPALANELIAKEGH